jgi:C1A family cysteine protease
VYIPINFQQIEIDVNLLLQVYSGPPTYQTGHLVVVAGCGVHTDDTPYWLIRNSAGTDFGLNGYVKIKLGDNCFGIETKLMYPIRNPQWN